MLLFIGWTPDFSFAFTVVAATRPNLGGTVGVVLNFKRKAERGHFIPLL